MIGSDASASSLSTIIPLFILQIGGNVKDVAMGIFLTNLGMMIGAFFWGRLIDATHWRKAIVLLSLVGMIFVSASILLLVSDIYLLQLFSALVGFFSTGSAVALNMLVMEKSRGESSVRLLSASILLSSSGAILSMLAGYAWLIYFGDIRSLVIASISFAASSLAMASLLLNRISVQTVAAICNKTETEASHPHNSGSLLQEFRDFRISMLFDRPLRMIEDVSGYSLKRHAGGSNMKGSRRTAGNNLDLKSLGEKWRRSISLLSLPHKDDSQNRGKEFLLLLGAAVFFYISAAMIFGPYTPFLKQNGITDAEVFIATVFLHISRIALLPFNNQFVVRLGGEVKASWWSYWPRIVGIGIIIASAIMLSGNTTLLMIASIISFIALQIGFTLWHTTTSSLLFGRVMTMSKIAKNEGSDDNKGKMLGISSSVTGGGALVGSLFVGEVAIKYGYGITFGISAMFLMISLLLIMRFKTKQAVGSIEKPHKETHNY